jgi:hypothetical protein
MADLAAFGSQGYAPAPAMHSAAASLMIRGGPAGVLPGGYDANLALAPRLFSITQDGRASGEGSELAP